MTAAQQTEPDQNGAEPNPTLRVLIVRVGAMGDILHALPAVAALRHALPRCTVGWAIEPHWTPLLAAATTPPTMPLVDRIHPVPTRQWKRRPFSLETAREIASLRRSIRAAHYDLTVDLQGSIRSALIGSMAGRARLTGPDSPREPLARLLYAHRVRTSSPHVIDQAAELLAAATGLPLTPIAPTLPVDPAAETWCTSTLLALGIPPVTPFIFLAPTAGWGAKEWGLPRYAALAQQLAAAGCPVLVNSSPGDTTLAAAFADLPGVHPMPTSLPQLIALTRRAALVIGGDSGPMHLAAALARPVLALFGPTDPARNGPSFPGATHRILRHPTSRTDHRRHAATEPGLALIPVPEVASAAFELLRQPELLSFIPKDPRHG